MSQNKFRITISHHSPLLSLTYFYFMIRALVRTVINTPRFIGKTFLTKTLPIYSMGSRCCNKPFSNQNTTKGENNAGGSSFQVQQPTINEIRSSPDLKIFQNSKRPMPLPLTHEAAMRRSKQFLHGSIVYTFHMKLNKGNEYEGLAEADFTLVDISSDLFFDYTGKQVPKLIINGANVEKIQFDGSFVKLPKEHLKEGSNNIIIHFKTEYNNDGNGCVSFIDVDTKQYIYTQCQPYYGNSIFPIFDQPDLKAKMILNVIAPSEWKVLSNQKPTAKGAWNSQEYLAKVKSSNIDVVKTFVEGSSGQMVLHPETKLLPNYLFCFVAGEYSELECPNPYKGLPMSLYCIESLIEHLKVIAPFIWEITIESMKFFESFFGYPFSFNKYEQIFAHEYKWGAMENAGIVTFNDLYVFKEKVSNERMFALANTISHELAHHWFGNLVTMKWWDDLWLNESFADFISYFCLDKIRGNVTTLNYDSSFASFNSRKGWAYAQDQMVTTHPIRGQIANTEAAESIFDGITYSKGASTMKQLLFIMKEENFSKALSEYFHKFEWKNTILDDFIQAMQHHFHSDKLKLEDWKKVWLETACLNALEPHWDHKCHEKDAKIIIKQSPVLPQHPHLRMHKIKVGLFKDDCSIDNVETWIDAKQESVVHYDGSKGYAAVLLNFEDWGYLKLVLDRHSVDFFSRNLSRIPDLLSRSLIWRSFFDMVKDSKITSEKYLEIFLNNIAQQTIDSIYEKQFDLIHASISTYTPDRYRDNLYQSVFYFILWLLKITPADKANRIIVLLNKLVDYAQTDEAKKIIIQWWEGKFEPLVNHKMTIGQQWRAVVKAHTLKSITNEEKQKLFDKQAEVDKSDTQKGHKLTCEAMNANKEEFQKLYESYFDKSNKLSASLKRSSMSGWNNKIHEDWLEGEYFDKFFNDLPAASENLEPDSAIMLVEYLVPNVKDLKKLIEKFETTIPKLAKNERIINEAKMSLDMLKRRQAAYDFFESTRPKL